MRFKQSVQAIICSGLLLSCGGSSDSTTTPTPTSTPAPAPTPSPPPTGLGQIDRGVSEALANHLLGADFETVVDVGMTAIQYRDPEAILALGLTDTFPLDDVSLTDIRFDYQRETLEMWQVVLDALNATDRNSLSESQQIDYDVLHWLSGQQVSYQHFIHYDFQASYFLTSVPANLELFFSDLHPLASVQGARDYITRLALVDDHFAALIDNLEEMASEGVVEPQITMQVAINRYSGTANANVTNHPYFAAFQQRLDEVTGLDASERSSLEEQARQLITDEVNPAYRSLVNFLNQQIVQAPADVGVGQYPRGLDCYQQRLAFHTTTDLTAQEIFDLGEQELARIHAELNERFDQLGYPASESLAQKYNRAATDGGIVPATEAVARYEALIDDAEQRMLPLFSRFPQAEVVVIGGQNGGFYVRASLDGSRPGAFLCQHQH